MLRAFVRLLRPTHWVKNVFVLAPVVFAQQLGDLESIHFALLAFACFCLASSSVYVVNDLRDRKEDRNHPLKRNRPLAAGTIGVPTAIVAALLLTLAALGIALSIGAGFAAIVLAYLVLNLLYSTGLKHVVIVDVMIIAIGFVLRVLGGGAAIGVEVSTWLLLCTIFVALFLALSKRRHELVLLAQGASTQRRVLSHYSPAFLDQMINVVTASTVVAYALYAISPETAEKFHSELLVYTIPLVLFGIFRYLYLIYQQPSRRNPTEAVVSDVPFLINMAIWAVVVIWIVYLSVTSLPGVAGNDLPAGERSLPEATFVAIAAYNESRTIREVLAGLSRDWPHVVVVDDGSTDETAALARAGGATVLRHVVNRGQGAALQTGLAFSLAAGARYIVTFDADGQHRADDIHRLLAPLAAGEAEVCLGSRFLADAKQVPPGRRLLLRCAVAFTRVTSGARVSDAHNGLRAFTRRAAGRINLRLDRMAHASEIIDQIARLGLPFTEVPVRVRYTSYSRAKGQRPTAAFKVALDYFLGRLLG